MLHDLLRGVLRGSSSPAVVVELPHLLELLLRLDVQLHVLLQVALQAAASRAERTGEAWPRRLVQGSVFEEIRAIAEVLAAKLA